MCWQKRPSFKALGPINRASSIVFRRFSWITHVLPQRLQDVARTMRVALVYRVGLIVGISAFIVNPKSSTYIYATMGEEMDWGEIWDGLNNENNWGAEKYWAQTAPDAIDCAFFWRKMIPLSNPQITEAQRN